MHVSLSEDHRLRREFDEALPPPNEKVEDLSWDSDPMLLLMAKEEEEAYDH